MFIWPQFKITKFWCLVHQKWNKLIIEKHQNNRGDLVSNHWKHMGLLINNSSKGLSHRLNIIKETKRSNTNNHKQEKDQVQQKREDIVVKRKLVAVQFPNDVRSRWCFLCLPMIDFGQLNVMICCKFLCELLVFIIWIVLMCQRINLLYLFFLLVVVDSLLLLFNVFEVWLEHTF